MRHTRTEVQKASSDRPPGTPGNVLRPAGRQSKTNKMGVPGASRSTGTPDVDCGGVLLSHTLSSAVPSPRPGLSFRVRNGTGRLTWAMTTAKPIRTANRETGGRQRNQPHDRFRSWRSGNRTTDASDKRFTGIVSVTTRNNAPCHPTKETTTGRDPTQQAGRKKCAAFAR